MTEVISWIKDNYLNIFAVLSGLVAVAEVVVRFTPTEKDDGAVQRIGGYLKKVMDWLKIPNRTK